MNFDDLHDPHPPQPDAGHLAAVGVRARQLRRRRTAMAVTAGVAAAVAIAVPAVIVARGGGDSGRIVPVQPGTSVPEQPVTTPSPTSVSSATPGSAAPAISVPAEPSTVAPSVPPIAAGPAAVPPIAVATTRPAVLPTGLVAIHGNGAAVAIDVSGAERPLYAAGDPTNPPAEGEVSVVDSALVTPDGRSYVSTCCEPVPGTWFEVTDGEPGSDEIAYGHGLALAPDGGRIATVGAQAITVSDLDRTVVATADLSSLAGRYPIAVSWLDDATLAVVEQRQDDSGITYWLYTVDAGLTGAAAVQGVQVGAGLETSPPDFAGRADDGSILLFAGQRGRTVSTTLVAYNPQTLAARPGSDITLPATAVDAWYGGHLVWVGADDVLHVDDTEVPGEFAWARPMP